VSSIDSDLGATGGGVVCLVTGSTTANGTRSLDGALHAMILGDDAGDEIGRWLAPGGDLDDGEPCSPIASTADGPKGRHSSSGRSPRRAARCSS